MRKLNITEKKKTEISPLENITEELVWIEKIAREFAKSKADLRRLYKCGLKAFQNHANDNGKIKHKIFVVRQAMLNLLNNKK